MRKIYAQYWGGLTLGSDVAEEIIGFSGNDLICARVPATDIIHAGKGNDVIEGGAGADQIDGGDGSDWVSYESAPAEFGRYGVTVDLEQGSGGNSTRPATPTRVSRTSRAAASRTGLSATGRTTS